MKHASKVNFESINQAVAVNEPGLGVLFMMGPTEFGPHADPSKLIINKTQFKATFGSVAPGSNFALMAFQALDAGVNLRVSRVVPADATKAASAFIVDTENNDIFKLQAIGAGSHYNDMVVDVTDPDPSANSLIRTLTITLGSIVETYSFTTPVAGDAEPYSYLDEVAQNSVIARPVYADISAIATDIDLADQEGVACTGGANGSAITAASSYDGNLESFDAYDDGIAMVIPEPLPTEAGNQSVATLLSSYAATRKDLIGVIGVPLGIAPGDVSDYLDGVTFDSTNPKFSVVTYGGVKYLASGVITHIPECIDVAALIVNQYNKKPWISPSGLNYGAIGNIHGVVTNLGSPASFETLETLTNLGVNSVVTRNGRTCLWNAYTMAAANSQEKFLNVVLLEIYLRRVLTPTMEEFLSEPNDVNTWSTIYYRVKPFLESLVEGRAFYEYDWKGDQFISSLDELEVNTAEDIQDGNYKAILEAKLISPVVIITIEFYKKSLTD